MDKVATHRQLIEEKAGIYGLRPAVVAGVVSVESGGDPLAINPEPTFLAAYKDKIEEYVRHCGSRLALANFRKSGVPWATSWGLMQILWPVAYERGLRSPWPPVLSRPEVGMEYGCRHLRWLLDKTDTERKAIAAYNGGLGNPNYGYANKVNAAVQKYMDW